MSDTKKNIQAVMTIVGVVSLVTGFALFKVGLGLIVLGLALLAPTFASGRK